MARKTVRLTANSLYLGEGEGGARLRSASSNSGDIVLDCFCGSGAALTVADQLGRDWIGAADNPETLGTTLHRFEHGTQPMGDCVGKQTPKRQEAAPSLLPEELPETSAPPLHQVEAFEFFAEPHLRRRMWR